MSIDRSAADGGAAAGLGLSATGLGKFATERYGCCGSRGRTATATLAVENRVSFINVE